MGKQRLSIGQQEIENAIVRHLTGQCGNGSKKLVQRRLRAWERLIYALHHRAKGQFAIGIANALVEVGEYRLIAVQIAVMRKNPVTPPALAHKWMAVLKPDHALCGLANVRDDIF